MSVSEPKPSTLNHGKFREAFLQGEEKEAANLFRQLLRQSIRIGLLEATKKEVEALCGPRFRPDPRSPCHRAGSETVVACMDGGREKIQRPRVRHETDGEVRLGTYEAASSSWNLFDQIVASVAEGLLVRGVEQVTGKAVSRSTASKTQSDRPPGVHEDTVGQTTWRPRRHSRTDHLASTMCQGKDIGHCQQMDMPTNGQTFW